MAMTRFDPREKFADRLWTREQVATMVEPLPEWLSGPCRLSLNGSWLMICDDFKKACWNEPLPARGDYNGLIRAFNAMPIEPGCESPFGRSENVNHKREAEDAKNRRAAAVLKKLAAKPWTDADEKLAHPGPGHGEVFINGTLDLRDVELRPGKIEVKTSDEHVDLSQYLDMPTEPPEDSWGRLQREHAHKIPACFTRDVDLSIFAPAARHQLEFMLNNGAKVCLEEFDYGNQLKVGWAWIAGADGEVRRQVVFMRQYPDGFDMKREPEKADKQVWPFPPYQPKQAGEDWEIWSKRRNGFIRVGRDAPRKEGVSPVHAPPDDLKYWPKCAKCDKPADFYEMEAQDMGALRYAYKIRVHHHGKVHVIEKGAMEIACLPGPLEAFTEGWDK